ncbi:TRAP transporter substrate-binding protein [Jiella sonneratiae]|uniref:TRAP transporter substrate-binding protein n=1 Tax=Jiella sonneratiae TaxID=2816856 RepID=A0ABS3J223_9HYPH|nr:TRAP transporter substrate-binding protein [Jiella sonneratiae]MBO0903722.1 TRAP transporter substrate-binding protein [Jiella sonneratiae]
MKVTWALAGLVASGLVSGPAVAEPQVIKYSYVDPDTPAENPTAAYAFVLKDTLERLTGGEMKVESYPNGQLGDNRSSIQQVRRGTIGMAAVPVGVLASLADPKLGVVDLPFLYTSRAQMMDALDLDRPVVKELVEDVARSTGIRIVSFDPYGFREMTTAKTPVKTPEDMAGLKMRTMEIVPHQEMMRALGANPVPIPFLELYTSLQTGVVDGEENTPINILQQKYSQVQDHMTLTNHLMTVVAMIVSEKWYQGLSDEERAAFTEAEKEARLAYAGIGAVQDARAIQELKESGMEVYAPTPEEIAAFRDATVGPIKDWASEEYGADLVDRFYGSLSEK